MSAQTKQRLMWGAGAIIFALYFLIPDERGFSDFMVTGLVLGLGILAVWLKVGRKEIAPLETAAVTRQTVQKTFAKTETLIDHLEEMVGEAAESWKPQLTEVKTGLERETLQLTVMGNSGVGKSTVLDLLKGQFNCGFSESSQLLTEAVPPANALETLGTFKQLPQPLSTADVVLFVTQGDLTQSEFQCLQALDAYQKQMLVLFNKQDQYLPAQRTVLQEKIKQQLQGEESVVDVVAIASQPNPIKVRRYQEDGSYHEILEAPEPDIKALTQRLNQIIAEDTEQLILQQTYQQTLSLQSEIQVQLNQTRHELAQPIIERYQWITGATAFANPVPTLDLLAAAAISGKMVMDLGSLYRLKFSVNQAQAIASTMASAMLKLGLVEISTQALSALLKGHAFTFVAGGLLQGVSAAHLTHVAGLSLTEHFQELNALELVSPESNWQPEKLKKTMERVFVAQQQLEGLKDFSQKAIGRFRRQGGLLESAT
ncbi:hypothetical protein C1752_00959 [Acaryochloris thomasi RCC1774]|uniref:DUF697 domain-containing protein n=1 Tax=Acaryochloris thomasi RCC1774 TaxID=1764569 RepID=A0A2W1JMI7_9CYAN|nr:DUF697 domain-containing protein [Acaryochloris thomasi]PZD74528.1 hypothetical protein C1752_00959 [Acaryochloris thomasi RCC1774]